MARNRRFPRLGDWRSLAVRLPPPAFLALLYLALIGLGTLLLKVPFAHELPVSWGEALFTAASAVTVTGLVVIDPGQSFTLFGEAVLLVLIQLGGLGLMTFAVLVLVSLGLPIRLGHQHVLREDLDRTNLHDLVDFAFRIARLAITIELIGAAALATVFVPAHGWETGIWHALFHAVSAFNNAGMALYPDNLTGFATNPIINVVIPALFILGGLGYAVLLDIGRTRVWRKYSLHTKMMLVGTLILSLWGFVAIAVLEWHNPGTLARYPAWGDRLWLAWFQSVSPRTAGFNTLDLGQMHDATALIVISFMVIGAGPASTAGGIKVTTVMVLILATIAFFRRQATISLFGRSLDPEQVMKVLALTTLSLVLLVTSIFALALAHDGEFLDLSFEVASALGTVGLTRGETMELDSVGRAVIIAMMYFGRIGPLTIGFFLATRRPPRVRYPKASVFIG